MNCPHGVALGQECGACLLNRHPDFLEPTKEMGVRMIQLIVAFAGCDHRLDEPFGRPWCNSCGAWRVRDPEGTWTPWGEPAFKVLAHRLLAELRITAAAMHERQRGDRS